MFFLKKNLFKIKKIICSFLRKKNFKIIKI